DQIRVDSRVRLRVGVGGAEQLAGVLGRDGLDGVDVLAAGVEPVPDRALGVLVRQPVAHGEQDGRRGVVLAGDQLQRLALVGELEPDRGSDAGLDRADDVERAAVDGGNGRGVVAGGFAHAREPTGAYGGRSISRRPTRRASYDCWYDLRQSRLRRLPP